MIQIYFLLSSECNLNCSFCIRRTAKKEVMPLQNAIKALEKVSSEYSNVQLIISGGEPFLYPNFDEIIEYACTRFRSVYINTNGTQCNSKISFLTRFADKITVQVSIDGDVYSHNSMRGNGVYEEAMRNISLMKENNIRIVVSSSVNKENNKSLKNIIPELELNRVDLWKISPIQAFTKAEYEPRGCGPVARHCRLGNAAEGSDAGAGTDFLRDGIGGLPPPCWTSWPRNRRKVG